MKSKGSLKSLIGVVLAFCAIHLFGGSVYVKLDAQGGCFPIAGLTVTTGTIAADAVYAKGYEEDPFRLGYYFVGWSAIANPKNDDEWNAGFEAYYQPVTQATTFYAIWEQAEPWVWWGDDGTWEIEDGVLCGRTDGETRCSYEIPGRGWVSFKWRVVDKNDKSIVYNTYSSSFYKYNENQFYSDYYDDPDYRFYVSIFGMHRKGETPEWKSVSIPVASPEDCEFVWEFQCGLEEDMSSQGLCPQLEIADISWTPATEQDWAITLELCGGTLSTTNVIVRNRTFGELPVPERTDCTFLGWVTERPYYPNDIGRFGAVEEDDGLPLNRTNLTLYAVWDVPLERIFDPFGTFFGEDYPWSACDVYLDGYGIYVDWRYDLVHDRYLYEGEYLRFDGEFGDGDTVFSTYVRGCGAFYISRLGAFEARTQGATQGATRGTTFKVLVDDVPQDYRVDEQGRFVVDVRNRGGFFAEETDRDDEMYEVHEIRLIVECVKIEEYELIESGYEYYWDLDFDWFWMSGTLGAMEWVAAPEEVTVTFEACGGTLDSASTRVCRAGETYGTLPLASRQDFVFEGWYTDRMGGMRVEPNDLIWLSVTTLYARWTSTNLTKAVGDGLRLATKGDFAWKATSAGAHGTEWAAATTAEVDWGRTNIMMTVVRGQGLLQFWWAQGENYSWDGDAELSLWIDGQLVAEHRQHSEWKSLVMPVLGAGNHVVEWKYTPGQEGPSKWSVWWEEEWVTDDERWIAVRGIGMYSPQEYWRIGQMRAAARGEAVPLPPGAWVDEISWMPQDEVTSFVTWARGVVEGRAWLTDVLPSIEAGYTAKIAAEPSNYEWVILRAMTKLARLAENETLLALVSRFGVAPDFQVLGSFFGELDFLEAPLFNVVVDAVVGEAVPVVESALADLELIPESWSGSILLDPMVYPVDVPTAVDLADVTLVKGVLKGVLSALAIAESYDFSIDYLNLEMEMLLKCAGLSPTFEDLVMDHPDFMKRVRDARRLAEGKELLRAALLTLQGFDQKMTNRSSDEMHFFEYAQTDSAQQQYAREEVAKLLAALDGMVEVNDDDTRLSRNCSLTDFQFNATLAPFFAGELTRRFLPAEIEGNKPMFNTFPNMTFGGMFPGLTKETVAGWLSSAYGIEVECTPGSDYDPPVKYRTFSAAIPDLGTTASEAEIADALAGVRDQAVLAKVNSAQAYADFERWASRVEAEGTSLKSIKSSPLAWQSYAVASPVLLTAEIFDKNLKVEDFRVDPTSGGFDFTVGIDDVVVGPTASAANLRQLFDLVGAEHMVPSEFSADQVEIFYSTPENGKIRFTARPKKTSSTFFMQFKRK